LKKEWDLKYFALHHRPSRRPAKNSCDAPISGISPKKSGFCKGFFHGKTVGINTAFFHYIIPFLDETLPSFVLF